MKLPQKMPFFIFILFLCIFIIIPSTAASQDTLIPMQFSTTAQTYVCIDDNLIATHVAASPAIRVYHPDGTLYKSIPLSNETSDIESLQISGNRLYYTEYDEAILRTSRTKTVYEYDMDTDEKKVIYTAGFHNHVEPKIVKIVADGDYVVLFKDSGGSGIILHRLSTGTDQTIFTSGDAIHGFAIDGDRIMWGCERTDGEPGREIHAYTISSGKDYIIPESKSIKTWGYGDISGDKVVWSMASEEPDTSRGYPSLTTAGCDIRMTDLSMGNTVSVEILNAPSFPYISGNTVVFIKKPERNSGEGIIRVYDIDSGKFSADTGSNVGSITNFDNGLIIWRKDFSSDGAGSIWLSSISGTIPTPVQTDVQNADDQHNNSTQQTPVDPVFVTSAVMLGGLGYGLLRKKK